MKNDLWYEAVNASTKLTQGDIILDCPVVRWASTPVELKAGHEVETLRSSIEVISADVIVITQACDLEQDKVANVILCPHISLDKYKEEWEAARRYQGHNPTQKAWQKTCEDIKNGYLWNLSMLNGGNIENLTLTHRVVDFSDVYTLPRTFIESLLQSREQSRLRLCPPYREHLSQAFARFFMRVGLPTGITRTW
ncbi:hypothetical protein NIES3585_23130 [Nodularia sp. NIES-3585]|nr:hypothetical protein NIES3585_23130 [Nodularia sp. NIES-3585]